MNNIHDHIQSFFKCAGSEACYSICLIRIAQQYCKENNVTFYGNELDALEIGIQNKCIDFNFNNFEDTATGFFVRDPDGFLNLLTSAKWTHATESRTYKCKKNEYEILFNAKTETDGAKGKGHFTTPTSDSLQNSQTVKNGFVYSKRIFRVK